MYVQSGYENEIIIVHEDDDRKKLQESLEELENVKELKAYYESMDRNINGFPLPIPVEEDSDYVGKLQEVLKSYYDVLYGKTAFNSEEDTLKEILNCNIKCNIFLFSCRISIFEKS